MFPRSYDLFGAKITPTSRDALFEIIKQNIESSSQCIIGYQNLHGMHVRLWDPSLNRLHRLSQTLVHIDGMPIVYLCKMRGIDAKRSHRLTSVDWIWPLLSLAEVEGWRVYYLGGTTEVLKDGCAAIRKRLPNLPFRSHHGYFLESTGRQSLAVVEDIVRYQPHLLLVGMGMGVQERWVLDNLGMLGSTTICTVGALMEYIAGGVATPPRWMGRVGLEWLFRLLENPSRFWYRYLVEPWFVLGYILWYLSLPEFARASLNEVSIEVRGEAVTRELARATGSSQI